MYSLSWYSQKLQQKISNHSTGLDFIAVIQSNPRIAKIAVILTP